MDRNCSRPLRDRSADICKRNFFSVSGFFNYSLYPAGISEIHQRSLYHFPVFFRTDIYFFFCGFFRCIISIIQIKSYTCFSQQFRCLKDKFYLPRNIIIFCPCIIGQIYFSLHSISGQFGFQIRSPSIEILFSIHLKHKFNRLSGIIQFHRDSDAVYQFSKSFYVLQ